MLLLSKECETESRSVVSNSLRPHRLHSPWNSPGQNTGVGKPFPSPGDLLNSEIEPQCLAFQVESVPTEPLEKPKNTEVGSLSLLQLIPSQTRNWTGVSCIAGGFFTSWATREAYYQTKYGLIIIITVCFWNE